ncbi:serine/threonine kinase [Aureococcus anophagefferens]|nr:serine/threonine kinase [Aureococcus anophagefferens]
MDPWYSTDVASPAKKRRPSTGAARSSTSASPAPAGQNEYAPRASGSLAQSVVPCAPGKSPQSASSSAWASNSRSWSSRADAPIQSSIIVPDLTCAATKRRFAALDIYAKATATSAGRSRHELVRLGELKPARRHSFDWLQFCRDGDRRPVARPPLTLFHELRYRLFQVREHLKEVMRGRDMGTKALFDSIDGDGSGEISREELGEAMRTIGVHVKATEVDELMDQIDADGSGAVDMDEFHNWLFGTEGQWLGKLRRCDARDPQNNARLMRREMLRFDPTVRELLRGFWVLSDADGSGSIDREEYMDLHLHLYAAMNVEVTRAADALEEGLRGKDGWKEAARAIAAREWEFDAQGRDFLDEHLFAVSLFQLVDAWGGDGPDKTASVLAKFLCFLMDRLSEIDDDRDAVVFKWADENEDWLDELKPIQDVLGSIEDLDTCLENGARKLQYLVPLGGDDWTGSDLDASSESSGDECPEASSDGESRDFVPAASRGEAARPLASPRPAPRNAASAAVHRAMGGKKKLFNKTSRKSLDAIGGMLGISPGQLQAAAEEANRAKEAERREGRAKAAKLEAKRPPATPPTSPPPAAGKKTPEKKKDVARRRRSSVAGPKRREPPSLALAAAAAGVVGAIEAPLSAAEVDAAVEEAPCRRRRSRRSSSSAGRAAAATSTTRPPARAARPDALSADERQQIVATRRRSLASGDVPNATLAEALTRRRSRAGDVPDATLAEALTRRRSLSSSGRRRSVDDEALSSAEIDAVMASRRASRASRGSGDLGDEPPPLERRASVADLSAEELQEVMSQRRKSLSLTDRPRVSERRASLSLQDLTGGSTELTDAEVDAIAAHRRASRGSADLPPLARRASIEDLSAEEVGAIMASRRASFQFASGPSAGDDFLGAELGRRRRSEMSGSILINDLEKGDDASYARQDLLPFEAAGLLEELLEDRLADDDDAGLGERRTRQQLLAELSRRGLGGESTPDYDETPEERSLRLGLASGAETPASLARSLQDLDGDDAPGAAYAEALGDLDRRLTELKQRLRGGDVSVEAEIGAVEARVRETRRKVEASRSVAALERAIVAMMPRLADLRSRVAAGELDCEDEYRELEARVREATAPASDADEVAELERRVAAAERELRMESLGRIHSPVDKRPTQFPALEDVGLTFATENALRPRTLRLTGDGLAEPDFEFSKRYDAFDRSREPGRPGWAKALYASLAGARDPFGRRNAKRRGQYLRDHGIATYGARGAASVAAPPPPDDDDAATLDCGDSYRDTLESRGDHSTLATPASREAAWPDAAWNRVTVSVPDAAPRPRTAPAEGSLWGASAASSHPKLRGDSVYVGSPRLAPRDALEGRGASRPRTRPRRSRR